MSIFDSKLDKLKKKYQPAIDEMVHQGVEVLEERLEGDKLYIKGNAPTQEAKDRVWDEIKMITPAYGEDLICDIDAPIRATPPREVLHGHAEEESDKPLAEVQEYVVKPGDTLSKISQLYYGDASRYMEIFEANSDVLMDPNKIKPGQKLVIPPKG